MRRVSARGLWQHRDFQLLWAGQSIAQFGSQATILALPLTAALVLRATPVQMGLLVATGTLPILLFGLIVGVFVDRRQRGPILIVADLGRCVLLATIPIAAFLGMLRIELLYLVAFGVGTFTTFFEVAYQSYLPSLVGRGQLVEGNSKLESTRALAQIGGPSLGGALVQLLTAPLVLGVEALSFLLSATFIARIRASEPAPATSVTRAPLGREIAAGLRAILDNRAIRALSGCSATLNFAVSIQEAVFVLYLTSRLELASLALGGILAAGNIGGLLGALGAGRVARRYGLRQTIWGGAILAVLGIACVPLARESQPLALVILIGGRFIGGLGSTIYTINGISLRQRLTPDRLLGRVNASMRFLAGGVVPLGAVIGGLLGSSVGLWSALLIGGVSSVGALAWLWWSDLESAAATQAEKIAIAND